MPKGRSTKGKARARTTKPRAAKPRAVKPRAAKPRAGAPGPAPSKKPTVGIGDLPTADSLVLQAACEACLGLVTALNRTLQVPGTVLLERTAKLSIPNDAVWESLSILESRGYVDADPWLRAAPQGGSLQVTFPGFELYLKAHRPDYSKLLKQFASLVNEGKGELKTVAPAMQVPEVLLDHVLTVFEKKKWIVVGRFPGGNWAIAEAGTSPELKRWLESPEEFVPLP